MGLGLLGVKGSHNSLHFDIFILYHRLIAMSNDILDVNVSAMGVNIVVLLYVPVAIPFDIFGRLLLLENTSARRLHRHFQRRILTCLILYNSYADLILRFCYSIVIRSCHGFPLLLRSRFALL